MRRVRIEVYLDPPEAGSLLTQARANGNSISAEAAKAIREHLSKAAARVHDAQAAPVLDNLLMERLGQVEAWLRPMVAATSINAATAMLLTLEILCGTRVDPGRAKETLDMMRGRAYKMIRRREEGEGER